MALEIPAKTFEKITTSNNISVANQTTEAQLFASINKTEQVKSPKQQAKEALTDRVHELLDLKDNFLKASIIKEDGKEFLVLTRDANDKERPKERYDFCNGAIKRSLRVKEGVLRENNNLEVITGRYNKTAIYDNATMERGSSLRIPLNELGQARYINNFFLKGDLSDYVQAYQNAK